MCSYLSRRQKFGLLVFFCIVTILLNFKLIDQIKVKPDYQSKCNFKMAKYVIENLCGMYLSKERIIGDMCPSLCDPKNGNKFYEDSNKNKFELVGCYNSKQIENQNFNREDFYDGLKTVLVYEQITAEPKEKRKKLVLKSQHQSFLDFDTHIEFDFQEKPIKDQLNFLLNYIRSAFYTNFGVSVHKDAIESLSKEIFERDAIKKDLHYYVEQLSGNNYKYFENALLEKNNKKLGLFIINLVVLLYQEEYMFYSYFKNKPEVLQINGTCGNFYAVEHAESLSHLVGLMNTNERLSLAKKFLKLTQNLDKNYLMGSLSRHTSLENELASKGFNDLNENLTNALQMCDVKLENFGLNNQNELKLIDTDMVKPNSYLFQAKYCTKHEDCHFFECKSFCEKNHCITTRVNNNLQALCENIFDNKIKDDSLISNIKNINTDLTSLINECKSPGSYKNSNVPIATNESLMIKLHNFLHE